MSRIVMLLALLLASIVGDSALGASEKAGAPYLVPAFAPTGVRVEESDRQVTLTGAWSAADPSLGWSGGSAMQSNTPGATA